MEEKKKKKDKGKKIKKKKSNFQPSLQVETNLVTLHFIRLHTDVISSHNPVPYL